MAELELRGLTRRYADHLAVAGVDLTVASGELVALLGPSGCGKTTVLRMIAGLIAPSSGDILIDRTNVTALPPHRRKLGLVFQSYALFPHLSVYDNVAFGLRRQGVRDPALRQKVEAALDRVRLRQFANRLPRQLSGGQQQRVALARAIAPEPRILLLDEPLSNLDAQLRDEMQIEIKRLQRELGITSIFVTHDQAEALSLSDRVCVLDHGCVQQIGTPEDIYHRPANGFVAGFIGRSNRLRGHIDAAGPAGALVRLAGDTVLRSTTCETIAVGTTVDVIIRYHAVQVLPCIADGLAGVVAMRSFAGAHVQLVVRLESGTELVAESADIANTELGPGARVHVIVDPGAVFITRAGDTP